MLYQCTVLCTESLSNSRLETGKRIKVQAHPIDMSKWYVVTADNEWSLHDKWKFDHLIDQYAYHRKIYGEFQLPVLEIEQFVLTVVLPSGYVSQISKDGAELHAYPITQQLNCGDVRFR